MARFADAKTYSEDEIKSWGDPKTWAQGRSLGPLADDILSRLLSISAMIAILKGGGDAAVWSKCMSKLSGAVAEYDGDDKTIYLGFQYGTWGGGAYGTNSQNWTDASVILGRHWGATVS